MGKKQTATHASIQYRSGYLWREHRENLITEEPLLIKIDGNPYSVVMRTPGDEMFHAAGFLLGEGLVDSPDDIAIIGFCEELDSNILNVELTRERQGKVGDLLKRRGFLSQTSCGICGKEMIRDICQRVSPINRHTKITSTQLIECVRKLDQRQVLYRKTRGSHAAMILDSDMNILAVGEDVGRHNALDKAIGKIFLVRKLRSASVAVLSSRISYEMVQKTARGRIPVVVSLSRPTSMAIDMAKRLNMTVVCVRNLTKIMVFCGKQRVEGRKNA